MIKEWYKDWFASEDYLDVYKHRNLEDTEKLVKLILSNVQISSDASILDAACGAGRYSIKFAELGFNVTGFDLSSTLLEIAKSEAEKRNLKINFKLSDIREFFTSEKYDLVVSLFTSFGYFDSDDENFMFINNAYKMLSDNGYYVLDYLNKEFLENNLVGNTEKKIEDKNIFESRQIRNNRVEKKIKIVKDNNSSEYLESVKLYSYHQLIEKFNAIGFKEIKTFGDYEGNDYHSKTSERCIIIFQK